MQTRSWVSHGVTCSRAEESLALVAYTQNPNLLMQSVVREGLFDSSEVEVHSG